jgi:hypothetical protein
MAGDGKRDVAVPIGVRRTVFEIRGDREVGWIGEDGLAAGGLGFRSLSVARLALDREPLERT